MIDYDRLDAVYLTHMLSPGGEVIPPVAWLETLGIEHMESQRWGIEHLRGLIEAYQLEDPGIADGELLLVCAMDMFLAGLALGLGAGQ